jgi:hypothetical protein
MTKIFFSPLSFVAVFDPGSGMGKNQDPGSGINIPDPPHRTQKKCVIYWFILKHFFKVNIWKKAAFIYL